MKEGIVYVFDNDDTLYDYPKSFKNAITDKMITTIAEIMQCSSKKIQEKRQELFKHYKTHYTLLVFYYEGIIKDIEEFIKTTYLAVDPRDYGIRYNPRLKKVLKGLEAPLYLHTNNPSTFAKEILRVLGIDDLFARIYGMLETGRYQKPDPGAFHSLLECISNYPIKWYVDNEIQNLITAKQLGFKTILVAEESTSLDKVDRKVVNVLEITPETI